jgi:hypothetical protein
MSYCLNPNCTCQSFEAVLGTPGGVYGHKMILVQCTGCKCIVGVSDPYSILGELYNIRDWIKEYSKKVGVPFVQTY